MAGLAAADHCDQDTASRKPCALADGKSDRSDGDDGNVDKYADCADDHCRDRDGGNRSLLAEFFYDGLGYYRYLFPLWR